MISECRMGKRFRLKTFIAVVTFFAFCCVCLVALEQSIVGRTHYARKLEAHIDGLIAKRPSNLSSAQWQCMINWTRNLHGNSLIAFQVSTRDIAAFEVRVGKKLSGNVDAATIEWIWDEYAKICPGGQKYQRFRIMMNKALIHLNSPELLEPAVMNRDNVGYQSIAW